jgi:hypothetical protein
LHFPLQASFRHSAHLLHRAHLPSGHPRLHPEGGCSERVLTEF